ncbi:MAG: hypothetical protein AAF160_09670 [Pseudomonadota bacterium]
MASRIAVPAPAQDSGAQVAELVAALQTQEAVLFGILIVAIGAFLFGMDAAQRASARRRRVNPLRSAEIRALRQARSRRLADTTLL